MKIAVTGATGYIGQRLVRAACSSGYEVLALSRKPVNEPNMDWQFYDLANTTSLVLPIDISAVYHLAAETQHTKSKEPTEEAAAQLLIDAAYSVGAVFIFVSSQTASPDAPTAYGRIKWNIERITLKSGGLVIRPGLVYGGPERGLFGLLCSLLRRLPMLPAFYPEPGVQPIHIDDLVTALLRSMQVRAPTILSVASPDQISFVKFLQAIAHGRIGRRLIEIPVPTILIYAAISFLGEGFSVKFGIERLASLFSLKKMDTASDLHKLSVMLRTLSAGATRSGSGRRELLREGHAFLTYVLRAKPAWVTVRRYVRTIEASRIRQALALPTHVLLMPAWLSLFDGAKLLDKNFSYELSWRLNASLMLAEASPQGASRFLGTYKWHGILWDMLRIIWAFLMEMGRRLIQFSLLFYLSRVGRKGLFK